MICNMTNDKGKLPTDEMYMSGRALFPLTINLADKLNKEFDGKLPISYAGGASYFNVKDIFQCGIRPITIATDLLKPGGYVRLKQMAEILENEMKTILPEIDVDKLSEVAEKSISDKRYKKEAKSDFPMKIDRKLEMTDCFIAPCEEGCPIHQDVPEYIRLIHEKRYEEAYELIISKNPLPFITGFICDHKCQLKCVRNDYEEPVLIRDLKRIAAEKGYSPDLNNLKKVGKTGAKVAVIGAGPAGLSSAYFLSLAGFDVTIFDKTNKAGGTVTHIIPDFRLPDWAIENDINLIKSAGVKFELNTKADFNLAELKKNGFKYINLAIGATKPGKIVIEGEEQNIVDALDFLRDFNTNKDTLRIGKNVAVIGGGNSAMDAARAALRVSGVKNVYIVYRRTTKEMPADREELEFALKDGVIFRELLNPVSLQSGILKCQKMKLGETDESGRRRPVPITGEFSELKIDFVITAVGEKVDDDILRKNGIEFGQNGKVKTDKHLETNLPNVFISGDAAHGPATVVEAIADGRKVAEHIVFKENANIPQTNLRNSKTKIKFFILMRFATNAEIAKLFVLMTERRIKINSHYSARKKLPFRELFQKLDIRFDLIQNFVFGDQSDYLFHNFTVFEEKQCRNRHYRIISGDHRTFVNINFNYFDFPVQFFAESFHGGMQSFARSAPWRPQIA
ncbi:MAG: hypothetical protein B6D62_02935 [Candidatus Cloacimonas sp. 4484_275]|nr:MAG: hypothetical protein B6D62_02935 [Candidatus Cloacimonas sp. 4484_275]